MEKALSVFSASRSAPVNTDCLAAFLASSPWRGRVAVAPAGWLAQRVVDSLAANPDVTLVGVIDRRPALASDGAAARFGVPITTPERWRDLRCDHFLILHSRRSREIAAGLLAAGVAAEQIRRPLEHPDYRAAALAKTKAAIERGSAAPPAIVVVQSSTRNIISDSVLAGLGCSGRMAIVALSEELIPSETELPVYCAHGSLEMLEDLLTAFSPPLIYLRTGLDAHLLFLLIRRWLPHARIIAEPYDFWGLLGDSAEDFMRTTVIDDVELAGHKFAEQSILRQADLVIGKRGGPAWRAFTAGMRRSPAAYHAGVTEKAPPPKPEAASAVRRPLRVADATALERPSVLANAPVAFDGYDNLAQFERIAAKHPVEFGVFNLLHRGPEDDEAFHHYATRYAAPPIVYARRVPLEALAEALAPFDYGWLNFGLQINAPDLGVVLPNRFCSYIGAGLPVIVSDRLARAAELVAAYDAGIVVPAERAEDFAAILAAADPSRHRQGAEALRRFLLERNGMTLAAVADMFAAACAAKQSGGRGAAS